MCAVYSLLLIFISTSATRCEPRRFDPYTAHHLSQHVKNMRGAFVEATTN
jgi:hypothetical protein